MACGTTTNLMQTEHWSALKLQNFRRESLHQLIHSEYGKVQAHRCLLMFWLAEYMHYNFGFRGFAGLRAALRYDDRRLAVGRWTVFRRLRLVK